MGDLVSLSHYSTLKIFLMNYSLLIYYIEAGGETSNELVYYLILHIAHCCQPYKYLKINYIFFYSLNNELSFLIFLTNCFLNNFS